MNTQQLRIKAVSRKQSLLMTIRMNKGYRGYSSMANGHSSDKRVELVAAAEKELALLVIPEIKTVVVGWMFEDGKDYLGCVYELDQNEAYIELCEYEDDPVKPLDCLKVTPITKVL